MNLFEDNDKNDFFEDSNIPEKPKEPVKPKYTPDDPRYWEEPASEYEHLKPSGRVNWKLWVWLLAACVLAVLVWIGYIRLFHPYVSVASQSGYVLSMEKRGDVFQTFEGVLLPYKNIMDTTVNASGTIEVISDSTVTAADSLRLHAGDIVFSTGDAKLAAELIERHFANQPVRIHYQVYHTALPWRGESKVIVTAVDSVNPANLLPPGFQPATVEE